MKQLKYKQKRMLLGYAFIGLWLVGFIAFFIVPIIDSLILSFNELSVKGNETIYNYVKFENFNYALTGDEKFLPYLYTGLLDLIINVPVILVCSFLFSILLKQEFRGNTFMKVIFFIPVVLGNGVFALYQSELLSVQGVAVEMVQGETEAMLGGFTTDGLIGFMQNAGLSADVTGYLMAPIERIYTLMSKSGVQTFIFLSGLKAVSPSLYESAHVEGCSGWDAFWKITLPMVSPMIIVNVIYTIVDSFASEDNVLLNYIYDMGFSNTNFGLSSAMSWIFFLILGTIVGIVLWLVSKRIVYLNGR